MSARQWALNLAAGTVFMWSFYYDHNGQSILGFQLELGWRGTGIKRALELNPSYTPAHVLYAHFLAVMDESVAEAKRALHVAFRTTSQCRSRLPKYWNGLLEVFELKKQGKVSTCH